MIGNAHFQCSEDKGAARSSPLPLEVDGGNKTTVQYRLFTMTFANQAQLAQLAVVNQAFSSGNDQFNAGTEYWYVQTGNLADLDSQDLSVSFVDFKPGSSFSPPSAGQTFSRHDGNDWTKITADTKDPLANQGALYKGTSSSGNTIYIRFVTTQNGGALDSITWYQLLPKDKDPARITPNGAFTRQASNAGVTAPSGQRAYFSTEDAS
ncbi:hypothetical protein [Sorangium sp. So ce131]|uniref:hypothetical protein n=1 Tax=Sorangium sp. So ce131 TaxID=3133282 RepID=UPI003F5F7058